MNLQVSNEKKTTLIQEFNNQRTWVEVDKFAITSNLQQFKNIIGTNVQLAVVAKSNAYGHGLNQIAQICQHIDEVNWICVFSLSEGITIRENGFQKPILVLGCCDTDEENLILYSIDIVAHDLDFIININELAKKLKKVAFIHIKIDTGLSRLGLFPDKALELIRIVSKLSNVKIRGLFSHFSESDANDQAFTNKQISRFNLLLKKLSDLDIKIPFIHSSNTAGIIRFDNCHFNFVRTGGGTYGLYKSAAIDLLGKKKYQLNLKLAMSWKSKIIQIKELPSGSYVSYARTFITYRPTKIAIVPIGYWDGYSRELSNKGIVYIKDQPGFVIGRVCMNMIIIDITDMKNIELNDQVLLVGENSGIRPDDIAQLTGSINYEVTTRINPLIPRFVI